MDCDITPRNSTDLHHLARVGMAWAKWYVPAIEKFVEFRSARVPTISERLSNKLAPLVTLAAGETESEVPPPPPQPASSVDFDFDNDTKADVSRWDGDSMEIGKIMFKYNLIPKVSNQKAAQISTEDKKTNPVNSHALKT